LPRSFGANFTTMMRSSILACAAPGGQRPECRGPAWSLDRGAGFGVLNAGLRHGSSRSKRDAWRRARGRGAAS
jgi:hypothetical protein